MRRAPVLLLYIMHHLPYPRVLMTRTSREMTIMEMLIIFVRWSKYKPQYSKIQECRTFSLTIFSVIF